MDIRFPARKPTAIIRSLMVITGSGGFLFNDRIKDGRYRSIKVWGWKMEHYQLAIDILRKHGFEDVTFRTNRIWVKCK
jgi:hypothetical protein